MSMFNHINISHAQSSIRLIVGLSFDQSVFMHRRGMHQPSCHELQHRCRIAFAHSLCGKGHHDRSGLRRSVHLELFLNWEMFAPAARPRRKNVGSALPPQQACPLRDAEWAHYFKKSLAAQTFGLALAFSKKKAPHFRAGLVGWVANGI